MGELLPGLPVPIRHYLDTLRAEKDASPLTIREYAYDLRAFCRWLGNLLKKDSEHLEIQDFAEVDRAMARRWVSQLAEKELARATRARRLAAVNGFFRYLAAENLIEKNPFASLPRPRQESRHQRLVVYLTDEQVEHLLRVLPSTEGLSRRQQSYHKKLWRRDRALIITLLYQGLRIGEAAALKMGNLDFEERILRVIGKGDKERIVPLHERTIEAINDYLDHWEDPEASFDRPESPLWRTLTNAPLGRDAARKAVQRHLDRAGLFKATPHKLRHTFGTRLANAEVDLLLIRDLMGHATIATTQQYTHVQRERMRSAIDQLR